MKSKNIPLYFFMCFSLLLASCGDKDKETAAVMPEPVAELQLSREIVYENAAKRTSGYSPEVVKANAGLSSEQFQFYSGVDNPFGVDHISFLIKPELLPANFIGTYSLKSFNQQANAATVRFTHYISPSSGHIFDSSFSAFEGAFEITAYDAATKTISGHYTIIIKGANDPYASGDDRWVPKKCDINIKGGFKNVKVK